MNQSGAAAAAHSQKVQGLARARYGVTAILLLAVTTAFFDRINVAVLFTNKEFQAEIGVSDPALMGLLMTAFVLPYGASMVLFSVMGDMFGPKRTLSTIAGVLGAVMAFMGTVSSYGLMISGRAIIGLVEGPQFGAATAAVKRAVPPRERGFANACWTIGSPLGSAIGFPLVIFLVARYGWRASFYMLAALNVFAVLPAILLFLREGPAHVTAAPEEPKISFTEGFGIFARDRRFWLLVFYDSGVLAFLWGLNAWLPSYLQEGRHFDLASTSFYAALPYGMMLLGELVLAFIADATGRRAAVCMGSLVMVGVFTYLAAIMPGAVASAWCIALAAGFWGGTTPTLFALGCEIIPAKVTAAGFGVYAGIANAVGSLAPLVIGMLVARTGGFEAGLMFLVACCLVSSLGMIPLIRKY